MASDDDNKTETGEPGIKHFVRAPKLKVLDELDPPPGASDGFKAYFAKAKTAIRAAVDQLGPGTAVPPPGRAGLLKSVTQKAPGAGAASDVYMKSVSGSDTKKKSLLQMDDKVLHTAVFMADEQNRTLRSIKTIVAGLADKVEAVGVGELKPAKETTLLQQVGEAVEAVWDQVNANSQTNKDIAYGDGTQVITDGDFPAGDAGDDVGAGGLTGMIQELAPMGMAAMPQAQRLSDLLGSKTVPGEDSAASALPLSGGSGMAPLPGVTPSSTITAPQYVSGPIAPVSAQPGAISSAINTSGQSRLESGSLATPWSRITSASPRIRQTVEPADSTDDSRLPEDTAVAEDITMAAN